MSATGPKDDAVALALRIGLVVVAAVLVLRLVLPGSVQAPTWVPWLLGGLFGGWNRKPQLSTRLVAVGVLAIVWNIVMTAIVFYGGPTRPTVGNTPAVVVLQVVGGAVGAAVAFVGMLLSSGWPKKTAAAPPSTPTGQVRVRIERKSPAEDGVVGRVVSLGDGVEDTWAGRRVMMLAEHDADEIVVPVDELIVVEE